MTKRDIIANALCNDVNLPTQTVITKIRVEYAIDVSPRHVQRVRKDVIAEQKETKGNNEMGVENDTFDTGKGLEDWQLNLINMVNEPSKENNFWSIQELAVVLEVTDDEVRETLKTFGYMISNAVLDESKTSKVIELPFKNEEEEKTDGVVDGGPSQNRSATREDYWEVKIDCVTACSKAEQEVNVFLNKVVRQKAMLFMKWAGHREWLAYLVGNKTDDGYDVTDLYLPDQRTSSTLVDKVKAEEYNNLTIVGVIHSHHDMGAGDANRPSFSGHDAEFINSNHNLSLLAGVDRKKGGFKIVGIARVQTPCGGMMKVKANIKQMKEEMSDEIKALSDEFKGKVFGQTNSGLPGKEDGLNYNTGYVQPQMVDHRVHGGCQRRGNC